MTLPGCFMCWADHDPDETVCPPKPKQRQTIVLAHTTFTAKYEGDCTGCDLPIYPGQRVARVSDTDGQHYGHVGCV